MNLRSLRSSYQMLTRLLAGFLYQLNEGEYLSACLNDVLMLFFDQDRKINIEVNYRDVMS